MQRSLLSATTAAFLILSTIQTNHAFSPSPTPKMTRALFALSESSDDPFDIEAARQQLEHLMFATTTFEEELPEEPRYSVHLIDRMEEGPQYGPTTVHLDVELPPVPVLTSMERERRLAEIQLLERLAFGDDATADLWTLWIQERGAQAAKRLWQVEEWINERQWNAAETELRALVAEYGPRWAEPVHRLSKLLYMQGRYIEAHDLCLTVLAVKPWQIGGLSTLVMIHAARQETTEARQWAARRLPHYVPDSANRRRLIWVEKAVQQARKLLNESKEALQESFGDRDEHVEGAWE